MLVIEVDLVMKILRLQKDRRQALLSTLEECLKWVSPSEAYEIARIEDIDEGRQTAKEEPEVLMRAPWRYNFSPRDVPVRYKVLASIKLNPANLGDPVVLACVSRWQKIVAAQNRVPDYVYKAAKRHLNAISEMLISAAEQQQIPKELATILKVPKGELVYLSFAMEALCKLKTLPATDPKCIRRKSLKAKVVLIKEALEDINPLDVKRLATVIGERSNALPWIEKVTRFLHQRGLHGRWEAWQNAYIAWRTGLAQGSVAKYFSQARKQVREQAGKLSNSDPHVHEPARLYSKTLLIKKGWEEIDDLTPAYLMLGGNDLTSSDS